MISVPASDIQRNFGEWHDRSFKEPVEITKYGRTSAYLVSAPLFQAMWASFRRALPAASLSETDIALILDAQVATSEPYNLDDIPDLDEGPKGADL